MAAPQVPEDLRTLKDFPVYDASFQDGPCFRQNLTHWALKTEKLSSAMTNLANSLQVFHSSGLEHYKAAVNMVQSMQDMADLCGNSRASSIGTPLHQFSEELSKIWRYYDAFLAQTEMLHIGPFHELANSFVNLKKLYDELLHYRKEYVSASEKLCASRHLSNLPDKTTFTSLTEACYSAQKTYRLVLCKYLTLLRQAHTKDMMSLLKRVMDHILSLFAYHDNSTKVLKEMEPSTNDLLTKNKEWDGYFDKELLRWGKLHTSVQRHIMAEFQFNIGLLSPEHNTELSWGDSRETSKRHHKKHVNIATPPHNRKSYARSPSRDSDFSNLDRGSRLQPPTADSAITAAKQPSPKKRSPVARTRSSPHFNPEEASPKAIREHKERRKNRKMIRSSSNPDLLAVSVMTFKDSDSDDDAILPTRNSALHSSLRNSGVHDVAPNHRSSSSVRYSQTTTTPVDSPAHTYDHLLARDSEQQSPSHNSSFSSHFRQFKQKKAKKKEEKKVKKSRKLSNSMENIVDDKEVSMGGSNENHIDAIDRCTSNSPPSDSPKVSRKNSRTGPSIFKRAGRNKSKDQLPVKESSSKESSLSPPPHPNSPPSLVNGGGSFDKSLPASKSSSKSSSSKPSKRPSMLRSSSSSHPVVSGPTLINKQPELENFDLDGLVKPVDENWTKSGYLWLRMKLPNNHYAWTHIYCVVDKQKGELMIQEQSLPQPRKLENLMLCNTRSCPPSYIDRNYCFRVISPSSEHLFQVLNDQQLQSWVKAMQEATEESLKNSDPGRRPPPPPDFTRSQSDERTDGANSAATVAVPNALNLILSVPGNRQCADCSSTTDLEWASVNLGIVLCIKCSGVHRGLGVHVSKVRSLNLDKWDKASVDFMQSQGNDKSNSYYEANLGKGLFEADTPRPSPNAAKEERQQFIQLKYVALAFVPDQGDDRMTPL